LPSGGPADQMSSGGPADLLPSSGGPADLTSSGGPADQMPGEAVVQADQPGGEHMDWGEGGE
jgi:hypothetical protein